MLRQLFSLAMVWVILHHLLRARPDPVTGATMTTTAQAVTREELEARARRVMARRVEARGWDTQRERTEWLHDVDTALDAYNARADA